MAIGPGVGDTVPDLGYTSTTGEPHRLSEIWADGTALILWLRHFG